MKRRIVLFVLAACVLVEAGCNTPHSSDRSRQQTQTQPAPSSTVRLPTPDVYDFSSLDDLLARIARKHGGCALVIVKDDRVIYRKDFGSHGVTGLPGREGSGPPHRIQVITLGAMVLVFESKWS